MMQTQASVLRRRQRTLQPTRWTVSNVDGASLSYSDCLIQVSLGMTELIKIPQSRRPPTVQRIQSPTMYLRPRTNVTLESEASSCCGVSVKQTKQRPFLSLRLSREVRQSLHIRRQCQVYQKAQRYQAAIIIIDPQTSLRHL